MGSAALNMAMVACGAADAYFETGIHIWDIAAGELLITEAGGVVIDPAGGEVRIVQEYSLELVSKVQFQVDRLSQRVLGASTQQLAERLSRELTQHYPGRD